MNIMLLSVSVWSGRAGDMDQSLVTLFCWLSALIALPTVVYAGQPFYASALSALKGRRLNMDVPISLAIILATGMSLYQTVVGSDQVYFDAAVSLLFFLLIGRYLDEHLRVRARGEAQNLLSLQSGIASLIGEGGSLRPVPAHALVPGDKVLIGAGERVPADALVLSGSGDIDQSLITGETIPVAVAPGAQIYAGTLNLGSALTVEVTAADSATLLAEIGRLMAAAEQGKARYRRLADRAAQIYAPAVHGLGAATFLGWLIVGAPWQTALTYAIAVLIITCPCALALAVPAVQIAAASRLFRQGIVIKAADGLERVAEADMVVFDKTGTLTLGRPELVNDAAISDEVLRVSGSARRCKQASLCASRRRRGAEPPNCRGGAGGRRGDTGSRPGAHFALRRGAAWVCRMVRHCPRPRRGQARCGTRGIGGRRFAFVSPTRCSSSGCYQSARVPESFLRPGREARLRPALRTWPLARLGRRPFLRQDSRIMAESNRLTFTDVEIRSYLPSGWGIRPPAAPTGTPGRAPTRSRSTTRRTTPGRSRSPARMPRRAAGSRR